MEVSYRNKNRGYQQLRVWQDAILKLFESLERKEMQGDWVDHLVLKESNIAYGGEQV